MLQVKTIFLLYIVNPNRMTMKKCMAVQVGVINDQEEAQKTFGESTPPPRQTPMDRLAVIDESQPVRIHKNTTPNRWKLLLFE
jgi:hypothetical protein